MHSNPIKCKSPADSYQEQMIRASTIPQIIRKTARFQLACCVWEFAVSTFFLVYPLLLFVDNILCCSSFYWRIYELYLPNHLNIECSY